MLAVDIARQNVEIGQMCYLKAADQVFDAMTGKTLPRKESGPFFVTKIYQCGEHIRISAEGGYLGHVDAAMAQFRVIAE